MPCSSDHFIPVLDEIAARPDPESSPTVQPPSSTKKQWGGRRPGAGAPKGNLNGFRHGRNSRRHKQMAEILAQIPEFQASLIAIARRRRQRERAAQAGAGALLAELLRRVGEAVLHPEDNQLESNQEFLEILRSHEARIREILKTQSKEAPQNQTQSNHPASTPRAIDNLDDPRDHSR